GQLVSASLMDYALPRAADIPPLAFETCNVPCRTNPLGVKGAGEAGAIGACPAVMNAGAGALWGGFPIRHADPAADAGRPRGAGGGYIRWDPPALRRSRNRDRGCPGSQGRKPFGAEARATSAAGRRR